MSLQELTCFEIWPTIVFVIIIMFTKHLYLASLVFLAAASGTFSRFSSPTSFHAPSLPTAVYATPAPATTAAAIPAASPTTTQIFTVAVPLGLGPENAIFNAAILGSASGAVTIRYDLAEDVLEDGKDRNLSFSSWLSIPVVFTFISSPFVFTSPSSLPVFNFTYPRHQWRPQSSPPP
jgi:hypothetical protein